MLPWLSELADRFGARAGNVELVTVEALMRTPVAIDPHHPVMLEGALACAGIALVTGRTADEVGFAPGVHVDVPVPIADAARGDYKVARISQASGAGLGVVRYVRKRTRTDALALRRVDETCADFKALNMPVVARLYTILTWHAHADADRLRELLRVVHALGRGRQGGLGAVGGWRVRPATQDRSWIDPDTGAPTRPLPVATRADAAAEFGAGVQVARIGYRAPYWHTACATLCAVPPLPPAEDLP